MARVQAKKTGSAAARGNLRNARGQNDRTPKPRVVRLGRREIITEGLQLSFWADISHRCMTASWPAFVAGAALVFVLFNAVFAVLYRIGNSPISNVPHGAYIDYLYFSIETLSTAGYGDMHPQTHYGHFIATVELFTGIFSMSLMTGLIFARFSRPSSRVLFAKNAVVSNHEGEPTLMVRFANERHNVISNATAKLWMLKNIVTTEGHSDAAVLRADAVAQRKPGFRTELDAVSRHRRAQPALHGERGGHGHPGCRTDRRRHRL
jgi:inward rectifier potassium channel